MCTETLLVIGSLAMFMRFGKLHLLWNRWFLLLQVLVSLNGLMAPFLLGNILLGGQLNPKVQSFSVIFNLWDLYRIVTIIKVQFQKWRCPWSVWSRWLAISQMPRAHDKCMYHMLCFYIINTRKNLTCCGRCSVAVEGFSPSPWVMAPVSIFFLVITNSLPSMLELERNKSLGISD